MLERFIAQTRRFLGTSLDERVAGVRRDVGMLFGERPAPALLRSGEARVVDLSSRSRRLRVAEVIRETEAAVTLRFAQPVGAPVTWQAGQFLTLVVPTSQGPLRRAYSISTPAPRKGEVGDLCVTIKRVEGGRVSNQLVGQAAVGQWYEVRGPSGSFVLEEAERLLLVGGGSGITPLISILETALRDSGARVRLVYGNRRVEDIIFRERLERLQASYGERLEVRHVLDQAGRLDVARVREELDGEGVIYSCGPEGMMAAVREVVTERGWLSRLREERFSSPEQRPVVGVREAQRVVYAWSRGRTEVMVKPQETLLEAGLRAQVPMPFSCTMGGCGACRVQVKEGAVAHDEPNGLSAAERESQKSFACVGRPMGPCVIEVPA
jgi:ring-1,2-phenylacetyl-CoA epoxidase subunit PaaE